MTDNDYRAEARAAKAAAIADTLYELARLGNMMLPDSEPKQSLLVITPQVIDAMNPAVREQIVHAAGQKPASDATWRVVRQLVLRRGPCWPHLYMRKNATCDRCGHDPLGGLTDPTTRG